MNATETMPDGFEIRPAAKTDADEIARVHVACWRETYAELIPARVLENLEVESRARMWRKTIKNAKFATFVVVDESDCIVGFASCGPRRAVPKAYDGEFLAIYLFQAVQGQGLGRALLSRMSAALMGRGCRSAALRVVRDTTPARRFYEHLGGVDAGEESHKADDFKMVTVVYGWPDISVLIKEG